MNDGKNNDPLNSKAGGKIQGERGFSQCLVCGTAAYPGERFCSCCGEPLKPCCPACGASLRHPIANFCGMCGAEVNTTGGHSRQSDQPDIPHEQKDESTP